MGTGESHHPFDRLTHHGALAQPQHRFIPPPPPKPRVRTRNPVGGQVRTERHPPSRRSLTVSLLQRVPTKGVCVCCNTYYYPSLFVSRVGYHVGQNFVSKLLIGRFVRHELLPNVLPIGAVIHHHPNVLLSSQVFHIEIYSIKYRRRIDYDVQYQKRFLCDAPVKSPLLTRKTEPQTIIKTMLRSRALPRSWSWFVSSGGGFRQETCTRTEHQANCALGRG